jgi:hypothetical protein
MRKAWEYWETLQLLPTKENLPEGAVYLKADKDEGFFVDEGEYEVWYGDGSNRFREWLENLIAIPAKVFFWKKCPKPIKEMYYSYANVVMELLKKPVSKDGLKGRAISSKPKIFVFHSRGIWIMAQAILLKASGFTVEKCIAYGTPRAGGRKLMRVLRKLGLPVELYIVKGDWVPNRPLYGDQYYTVLHRIKNSEKLKGIKNIHLSYGYYLKKADL